MNTVANVQKAIFFIGLNFVDTVEFCFIGKITRIRIDATKANTPPSLLGIDRRIA